MEILHVYLRHTEKYKRDSTSTQHRCRDERCRKGINAVERGINTQRHTSIHSVHGQKLFSSEGIITENIWFCFA